MNVRCEPICERLACVATIASVNTFRLANIRECKLCKRVFLLTSVAFGAHCIKVVEDTPILSVVKCMGKRIQFLAIYNHLWRYLQGITPSKSVTRNSSGEFSEIMQCNGHYNVQGHSRSSILLPFESSHTTSY